MEFKDKVVVITGAGSGIGRATAVMFAAEGAKVVACDVNAAGLKQTAAELEELVRVSGINCTGCIDTQVIDVRNEKDVIELVEGTMKNEGRIDILVNSAGVTHLGRLEDISVEQWDRVLDINLKGTFIFSKAVMPAMKCKKSGCIINVTAAAAKTGGMNVSGNYVASKGGVSSLTIHMAKQLASFGIRVNAVSPGPIETPMLMGDTGGGNYSPEMKENIEKFTPLGMGTPEDIAHGIMFLASGIRARYITGEILDIDGGLFMD